MAADTEPGLTIEEAKRLAQRWEAEREDAEEQAALEARFRGASASELARMWETRTNERRRALSRFEVRALMERWFSIFGNPPPSKPGERAPEPDLPDEDTMLRVPAVLQMIGKSKSQLKRDVAAGTFPQPIKIGVRAIGWPAREVKAWLAQRKEQR